jgi:hypothetical protein
MASGTAVVITGTLPFKSPTPTLETWKFVTLLEVSTQFNVTDTSVVVVAPGTKVVAGAQFGATGAAFNTGLESKESPATLLATTA